MTNFVLHVGDCREVLAGLPDASVDSIVTDPPYELGFMGKKWDAAGIAYDTAMWAEALRVLKPGGHLLAFGGTRTYHRMTCAIEDAGFEIRDSVNWVYGSGFPKSLDVSKAIDKAAGAERKVVGVKHADKYPNGPGGTGFHGGPGEYSQVGRPPEPLTAPATDDAARWSGWGTALKPAHEPIVVARKPLVGTVAANVLEHGTGALNIDACRVSMGTEYDPAKVQRQQHSDGAVEGAFGAAALVGTEIPTYNPQGRWPANIILTHHADCTQTGTSTETVGGGAAGTSGFAAGYETGDGFVGRDVPTVVWDCHPECPIAVLDGQSGISTGAVGMRQHASGTNSVYGKFDRTDASTGHAGTKDSGGASRYFTQTEWNPDLDGPSFHYVAKPAKKERNLGLDDKNTHPTVKPVALMRHLVRLVTPPGGTVLDPFTGSGTTGMAAMLEGCNFVGIEQSADYAENLATPRIEQARRMAEGPPPASLPSQSSSPAPDPDQPSLFD
jgi:site-specific DNA-methyltransferase (adenine-specific)